MRLFKKFFFLLLLTLGVLHIVALNRTWAMSKQNENKGLDIITLPSPVLKGEICVEDAINARRTRRSFSNEPLRLKEWGQMLWAAQGITETKRIKRRSAPSAGALYPLDVYLILGENALKPTGPGIFQYLPEKHLLRRLSDKDYTKGVARASLYQMWMAEAPGMILITSEYSRITVKYGKRGIRYSHIEAGHVAQNCFLQAEALKLAVGIVGAFEDDAILDLLPIPKEHEPLLILPVGRYPRR